VQGDVGRKKRRPRNSEESLTFEGNDPGDSPGRKEPKPREILETGGSTGKPIHTRVASNQNYGTRRKGNQPKRHSRNEKRDTGTV